MKAQHHQLLHHIVPDAKQTVIAFTQNTKTKTIDEIPLCISFSTDAQISTFPLSLSRNSGVTQTRNDKAKEKVTFLQTMLTAQAAGAPRMK